MIKRLLRDTAIYGVAGTASRFISVLLVPLYTRMFSPAEFGVLDLLITTSSILFLVSGMEVGSGIGRSYFEAKELNQQKRLIGTGLVLYLAGVAFWTLLTALGFHFWFNGYQGITWAYVLPLLLALLPTQILGYEFLLLRVERRPHLFALISFGDILTSTTFNIIAVVVLGWGVPGVMWGLFLSKLIWSLIGGKVLSHFFELSWSKGYAREVLTYSVPTVPSVVVSWAQNFANRFILVAMLAMTQVGIFSLAVRVASAATLVSFAFRAAWYPYRVEIMGKPGSAEKYARMLDLYLLGMFSLCAVIGALGEITVRVLSPSTYITAGPLVGFIAMGLFWEGTLEILMVGIDVVRKTYLGAMGILIGAAINLVTLWVTVQHWGIVAAGVSFLFGAFITVMMQRAPINKTRIPVVRSSPFSMADGLGIK